jgi:hypothetical protein
LAFADPPLGDVHALGELLDQLGWQVARGGQRHTITDKVQENPVGLSQPGRLIVGDLGRSVGQGSTEHLAQARLPRGLRSQQGIAEIREKML